MKRVCVFCGSNVGGDGRFRESAEALGRAIVERGQGLVYGGGSVGLMGVVADAVLAGGGKVDGVIPKMLATKELLHDGVTEMHIVESMHARKALMTELADCFIALPGGFGTFEELFEVITWGQLGLHAKPMGLLNVAGYYDDLVRFLDRAIAERFIKEKYRDLLLVDAQPSELLDRLATHRLPTVKKWIAPDET